MDWTYGNIEIEKLIIKFIFNLSHSLNPKISSKNNAEGPVLPHSSRGSNQSTSLSHLFPCCSVDAMWNAAFNPEAQRVDVANTLFEVKEWICFIMWLIIIECILSLSHIFLIQSQITNTLLEFASPCFSQTTFSAFSNTLCLHCVLVYTPCVWFKFIHQPSHTL